MYVFIMMRLKIQTVLLWTIFFVFTAAMPAFALDESSLPHSFKTRAIPYFESATKGVMITPDQVHIHYRIFEPSDGPVKGNVVIISGRTEFMRKYAELLYDLRLSGYRFFIYDHRGQGESERLLTDTRKGYVNHFKDYVSDLEQFMNTVVKTTGADNTYFLAHSMGGAIATRYVIEHPESVTAMVASSPMFQASTGNILPAVAYQLLNIFIFVGQGESYTLGRSAEDWQQSFVLNEVTTSEARYDYAQQEWKENNALIVAGPTHRWLKEALDIGFWIMPRAELIKTPLLVLQAGDETVVDPASEADVCQQAAHCSVSMFPGAKHQLLMEQDNIRNEVIKQSLAFFVRYKNK